MDYMFKPTVLECKRFIAKNPESSSSRIVKDYEFDFYVNVDREMYIENEHYHIGDGTLVLRTPGQSVSSFGDYDCYILTLDFSGKIQENYSRHTSIEIQPLFESPIWNIIPPVFTPLHKEDYIRIFNELISISDLDINENKNCLPLINEFIHLATADALNRNVKKNMTKTDFIDDCCNYIKQHYTEDITLDTLSELTHINKHYLTRKFKSRIGVPPISYLIQIRMDNAKRMLIETDIPIKNVSETSGYVNASFFNYYFKKMFGITPANYRDLYRRNKI